MASTGAASVNIDREGAVRIAGSDRRFNRAMTADDEAVMAVVLRPPGRVSAGGFEMDLVMGGRTRHASLRTNPRMNDGGDARAGFDSVHGFAEEVQGGRGQIIIFDPGDQGSISFGGPRRGEAHRMADEQRECSKILIPTDRDEIETFSSEFSDCSNHSTGIRSLGEKITGQDDSNPGPGLLEDLDKFAKLLGTAVDVANDRRSDVCHVLHPAFFDPTTGFGSMKWCESCRKTPPRRVLHRFSPRITVMPIRRLAPAVVNQIAAGEVVERPASVVKEVLENAFDAGATRVDIEIAGGGRDLIRIADDGAGIPVDELTLAVEAHATSKIVSAADLEGVSTMGFRGEALASIASVSRFSLESRTQADDAAWRIEVIDGVVGAPAPTAGPPGTRVEVRNLFSSVPARRRFLKSETAESARIAEVVRLLALARPTIGFRLVSNGRCLLDLPATDDPRRRIVGVLGEELDGRLIEVREEIGSPADGTLTSVWGLVGLPETARPTAKNQRFILNGRAIVDRSLSHALKEGFRGLVEPGRHPVGVCYLEMNPARVDVNVHPAKTEVRFREARPLHGLVRRAVQDALQRADLVRDLSLEARVDPTGGEPTATEQSGAAARVDSAGSIPRPGGDSPSAPFSNAAAPFTGASSAGGPRSARGVDLARLREAVADVPLPATSSASAETSGVEVLPTLVGSDAVLQVHQSFLVTQDAEGLVIIDQHALHERVMFEKLHDRYAAGPLESQRQLVPIVFDADPASIAALESLAPLLERLGIDATAAGPRGVAIHGFPTLLITRRVDPGPFLSELLERAAQGEIDRDDHEAALADVLDVMSCKAAVKAGDRLGEREIAELLAMRDRIDREGSCPHGRPTHLRIPIAELERRFGRSPG